MSDANDRLMAGSVKSAKFEKIGAKVSGTIVRISEVQQQRDIKDGTPMVWSDGKPREQIRVVLATDAKDDSEDNGERAIFIRLPSALQGAIVAAVKAANEKGLQIGGKLAVKYTKDGPKKNPAFNAPKVYAAKYEAPDPATLAAMTTGEEVEAEESLDDF